MNSRSIDLGEDPYVDGASGGGHRAVGADGPGGRSLVIALVCSAGGLDALSRVLAPLPASLPAAVLALQHMQPDQPSHLPHILACRTALPVTAAHDGDQLLPGRVLVAPPGYHTLIAADRTIALIDSGALPPYRPSADLLLTTLAVTIGHDAIAVVLTGAGNDAATGATAVHRFGGTVIAASLASSHTVAMPQATMARVTVTDHVTALDDLPALLVTLTTRRR
jgi:two-component system chemotaxis response regulator CheB